MENVPLIGLHHISKTFPGGIQANDDCMLDIYQGEVHAIVGENGAGKSTLMNALYGLHRPDSGEIRINGRSVEIENPRFAKSLGIQMVHQHFMLVPSFTVLQNIILGFEPLRGPFIARKEAEERVRALCAKYNLLVPLEEKVRKLPIGLQQRVEIVRAIYRRAEILILDEPTAVLTPQEADELFHICNEMINEDKTILFISHKLKEVMRISNRITVMRRGRTIDTLNKEETNEQELANLIIGEDRRVTIAKHLLEEDYREGKKNAGATSSDIVLEVRGITVKDSRGRDSIKNVSLKVHAGEVLGIAGVEGNGQTELAKAIAGILPLESGDIVLRGKSIGKTTVRSRRATGLRHIPEDRINVGLCVDGTICENVIADQSDRREFLTPAHLIKWNEAARHARDLINDFNIVAPDEETLVHNLSGGNMQKVVAARELSSEHSCLLVSHPTRGVDIGAADFIYRKIMDSKQRGVAILLISADLDELFLLSDQLAVLYEGSVVGQFDPSSVSAKDLGMYMTGAQGRE